MGDRHACIGRRGDGGRDARDYLEGDARSSERKRFLAAPSEDEGIAALEAYDLLACEALLDQERVDLVLAQGLRFG